MSELNNVEYGNMYDKIKRVFWKQPRWVQLLILRTVRPKMVNSLLALRNPKTGEKIIKEFQKSKCIFVHVPKTGGTSIKKALFGTRGAGHRSLRSYKIIFRKREFSDYFKFAFVRNPWDRVVSAYEFLRKGGMNESDKEWSNRIMPQYKGFNDFVTNWLDQKNIYNEVHFVPQYEFLRLGNTDPKVDYIGKFERLEKDFEKICNKLNKQCSLRHENKSSKDTEYREYYNERTRKIVGYIYEKDVELFEYSF